MSKEDKVQQILVRCRDIVNAFYLKGHLIEIVNKHAQNVLLCEQVKGIR